jgi:hypothetical protein
MFSFFIFLHYTTATAACQQKNQKKYRFLVFTAVEFLARFLQSLLIL